MPCQTILEPHFPTHPDRGNSVQIMGKQGRRVDGSLSGENLVLYRMAGRMEPYKIFDRGIAAPDNRPADRPTLIF